MLFPWKSQVSRIRFAIAEGGGSPAPGANGADTGGDQQLSQQKQPSAEELQSQEMQNIWETPKEDANAGNDQNKKQEPTPEQITAALDKHVEGMNLLEGVDTDSIVKGLSESDPTALVAALQTTSANTVKKLIPTMMQLTEKKIAAAVEKAVSTARGATQSDLAFQSMEQALPFTTDKAVNPVARAVMKQAMGSGKSSEEAVSFVKGFFTHVFKHGAKDLGIQSPPRNRPGSRPSPQNAAIAEISDSPGDDTDWEKVWKESQ